MTLTDGEKSTLLALARQSIAARLAERSAPALPDPSPALAEPRGCFVTIYRNGDLRGCLGELEARRPLHLAVARMAGESATSDPRFPPMTPGELDECRIEISALTPMRRVKDATEVRLGVDGVMIVGRSRSGGRRSGCFLPQVADHTGWSRDEFLSILCREKAGLPADAWRDPDTEIHVFQAEVFGDPK